jgi:hypothetical protein
MAWFADPTMPVAGERRHSGAGRGYASFHLMGRIQNLQNERRRRSAAALSEACKLVSA